MFIQQGGGGAFTFSTVNLFNTTVSNTRAAETGGVFNAEKGTTLTISECTFEDNEAKVSYAGQRRWPHARSPWQANCNAQIGAALFINSKSLTTLTGVDLVRNKAVASGG